MRELGFWIYLLIGLGAAFSMDIRAREAYPEDSGFRVFSAVLSTVAWPLYVGTKLVSE